MQVVNSYTFDELAKDTSGIMIETQDGVCLTIRIVDGKTLILFPYGNYLATPESVGHLSSGVLVLPRNKPNRGNSPRENASAN